MSELIETNIASARSNPQIPHLDGIMAVGSCHPAGREFDQREQEVR
jgi:hypothetical protein